MGLGPGIQNWLAQEGGAGVPLTPVGFYKEAIGQEAPSQAHRTRRAVTTVPLASWPQTFRSCHTGMLRQSFLLAFGGSRARVAGPSRGRGGAEPQERDL